MNRRTLMSLLPVSLVGWVLPGNVQASPESGEPLEVQLAKIVAGTPFEVRFDRQYVLGSGWMPDGYQGFKLEVKRRGNPPLIFRCTGGREVPDARIVEYVRQAVKHDCNARKVCRSLQEWVTYYET